MTGWVGQGCRNNKAVFRRLFELGMVEPMGIEPTTSRLRT